MKKILITLCMALAVGVTLQDADAGEKVEKKILKQVDVIESADPLLRKEVLIKMLEILAYEEINFEDLISSATDDVEAKLTELTAKAD